MFSSVFLKYYVIYASAPPEGTVMLLCCLVRPRAVLLPVFGHFRHTVCSYVEGRLRLCLSLASTLNNTILSAIHLSRCSNRKVKIHIVL